MGLSRGAQTGKLLRDLRYGAHERPPHLRSRFPVPHRLRACRVFGNVADMRNGENATQLRTLVWTFTDRYQVAPLAEILELEEAHRQSVSSFKTGRRQEQNGLGCLRQRQCWGLGIEPTEVDKSGDPWRCRQRVTDPSRSRKQGRPDMAG
ncbi:MAG TPA: hypothetical protein DCQ30_06545 [Acidimicrobiaceae bacterium]|nr:hypothetical protein [Acidimicrobiaceae bacterium]